MKEMQSLYDKRFKHINNFCSSFVKMQMFFWSAYGKQCSSFLGPMKAALQQPIAHNPSSSVPAKLPENKAMEPPTQTSLPKATQRIATPEFEPQSELKEPPSMPANSPPKAKPKRKKKKKKKPLPATAPPPAPAPARAPAAAPSPAEPQPAPPVEDDPFPPPAGGGNVFDDFEF
uniref:Uncharacterized protein n=1 Tax=Lotharella oceanica TaxID=641309 RepID=A0A7S2TRC5_9EUKA